MLGKSFLPFLITILWAGSREPLSPSSLQLLIFPPDPTWSRPTRMKIHSLLSSLLLALASTSLSFLT